MRSEPGTSGNSGVSGISGINEEEPNKKTSKTPEVQSNYSWAPPKCEIAGTTRINLSDLDLTRINIKNTFRDQVWGVLGVLVVFFPHLGIRIFLWSLSGCSGSRITLEVCSLL